MISWFSFIFQQIWLRKLINNNIKAIFKRIMRDKDKTIFHLDYFSMAVLHFVIRIVGKKAILWKNWLLSMKKYHYWRVIIWKQWGNCKTKNFEMKRLEFSDWNLKVEIKSTRKRTRTRLEQEHKCRSQRCKKRDYCPPFSGRKLGWVLQFAILFERHV